MRRSLVKRLARSGYVVERVGFHCERTRRRCRWRVSQVTSPDYAAGFVTVAEIDQWMDDVEWDNASLPIRL